MTQTRRDFLKTSAVASAALGFNPLPGLAQGSPNSKIVVASMGVRSRGLGMSREFAKLPNTEIGVICDVDERYAAKAVEDIAKIQGSKPRVEKDIRKVVEDPDIDAVLIASPDHWHAPAAILSVAHGKHVYLEKPCSHNPREGELLIEAQKKYDRVIHMGNQRRSWPNVIRCMQDLHSGIIGKVYFAKGWYANNREPIGFGKEAAVPEYLDWGLWQGPAPRTAYRDNVHPYNWHWFTRWGTGEALNNGTHEIDVMRWGLGVGFPTRVMAMGGRLHYDDDWQFPDTMVANYEFEDGKAFTWEGRSCNNHPIEGTGRGVIFYGEKGTVRQIGHGYTVYANDADQTVIKEVKSDDPPPADSTNTMSPDASLDGVHVENFLRSVRDGVPNSSPIDEGHKSVLLCQLANIAWFRGEILDIDTTNGHIEGDREAMKLWGREYEKGWAPQV